MAIPILSAIFGQKPQIAGFQDVILGDEQIKAILANIKAFPNIEQLGNLYQQYVLGAYESAVPGFGKLLSGITGATEETIGNAKNLIEGILPQGSIAEIARSAAQYGLRSGLIGSPMAAAEGVRELGIGTLQGMQLGEQFLGNAAQRWQQLGNFAASTFAPITSMFITPQQQAEQTTSNRLIQRQIQQEKYNVAAAPDPIMHGLSDIVMYLTGQYLGSLGGGKMGGGGGGLPGAGNAAATAAASGDVGYMGGMSPAAGPSDITNPGQYVTSTSSGGGGFNATADAGSSFSASGFDYGTGYPTSDVTQYFGGSTGANLTNPTVGPVGSTDILNYLAFQQSGNFPGLGY